jgi:hypothetical protein
VRTRTDTGYFGRGFYFSADFNTGVLYAGGSGALLLCKVLVGKGQFHPIGYTHPHLPTASPPSLIHNDRHAAFVSVLQWTLSRGMSHDMEGVRQPGCQRQPNFDSHVSNAQAHSKSQEIVVFEPEQVLPAYRIKF